MTKRKRGQPYTPTWLDVGPEKPLAVACPVCAALPAEHCRSGGLPMMQPHGERVGLARKAIPTEQREHNGIIIYGRRQVYALDDLHNRGKITDSQHKAGKQLAELYEAQFKSPEQNAIIVDRMPDYGMGVVMRIQSIWDFRALWQHVPKDCRAVVEHVACLDLAIRDGLARNGRESDDAHERLRRGLNPVVKILGV